MVKSTGWDWNKDHGPIWEVPAEESYYYLWRWQQAGLKRFLDLGCGIGRHALQFAGAGYQVTAFDLAASGLERVAREAEARGLDVQVQQGDMMELPFAAGEFDCLLSYHCIYHTDKAGLARAIAEIRRVMKPGGEVFFTLNSKSSPAFKEAHAETRVDYVWLDDSTLQKREGNETGVPHCYLNETEVGELLREFEMIRLRHVEDVYNGKRGCHFFVHAGVN